MNDTALDALLARARACPPDTAAEEAAFETRLLARLREHRPAVARPPLAWRLWPWFAAPAAALAVWTLFQPPELWPLTPTGGNDDLDLADHLTGKML